MKILVGKIIQVHIKIGGQTHDQIRGKPILTLRIWLKLRKR